MKLFYDEVKGKRKSKRMKLQLGNEFHQVKIKDLDDENNVEMFTFLVRGSKVVAAEQKIREIKTRIKKLDAQKLKITPSKIIQNSTQNMNKKCLSREEIEKLSLASKRFRTI